MLLLGGVLLVWIVYNLFVERQAQFTMAFGGLIFLCALIGVGLKWVSEGRALMEDNARPRRRRKKRSRPIDDE